MSIFIKFLYFLLINLYFINGSTINIDSNGYILYCPCMGRFGNQADHFLGALGFAEKLNRTLVLPPWVEYRKGEIKSLQIPFKTYFRIDELKKFHRVITMEDFMENLAPIIWPENERISFCYVARKALGDGKHEENGCNAKNGNPFGPFWDTFNVDFIKSEFYEPLNYDVHHRNMGYEWNKRYPSDKWPVLAFTGAPASFPVQQENRILHKYLKWSDNILNEAKDFIKKVLPKGAFLGIHLRNGIDWVRACDHIKGSPNLFAAAQCVGYQNEKGPATMEMCLPNTELIIRQIKRQIRKFKELNPTNEIKSIFVASDSNHMIDTLNEYLQRMKIKAYKLDYNNPHVDLCILALSNHYIGNCVSSFSAFVKRERDAKKFPSSFWGYPPEKNKSNKNHDEL